MFPTNNNNDDSNNNSVTVIFFSSALSVFLFLFIVETDLHIIQVEENYSKPWITKIIGQVARDTHGSNQTENGKKGKQADKET